METSPPLRTATESTQSTERPVGEIVSELWHNTEKLVRQELELGAAHLEARADALKAQLLAAAISGMFMLGGGLAFIAAIILALSKVMEPWLAAVISGAVLFLAGYILMPRATKLPMPQKDRDTATTHISSRVGA